MSAYARNNPSPVNRTKLYTVLGILIAIVVAVIIIAGNGVLERPVPAVTIGDETFDSAELGYYYTNAYDNVTSQAQMYASFGMSHPEGYNPSLKPADQMYDEENGISWHQHLQDLAANALQETQILLNQATAATYTLSEEGKAEVETQMGYLKSRLTYNSVLTGYSEATCLKLIYGKHMTMKLMRACITDSVLASEYANHYMEQLTYPDEVKDSTYESMKDNLDSYDYRMAFIAANPETDVDEEGKAKEPTEEQTAAAMDAAKSAAQSMVSLVKRGTDFNTAAMATVSEDDRESFSDPEYNHFVDTFGSSLNGAYASWLKDAARKAGDVNFVESDGSGYYVLLFLNRERRDNSYETVDVWSVAVTAETTDTTDAEGKVTSAPTEAQLGEARAKADEILSGWKAMGSNQEESFLSLADAYPEDNTVVASILSETPRNSYGAAFDQWAFSLDTPLYDSTVLEITDDFGNVTGYRVVYLNAFGLPRWEAAVLNSLRQNDYSLWSAKLAEESPITKLEGFSQVGL
jgi:hypothetical protein